MHQQFSKIRFATLWKFLLQYYGKIFCNFREKVLAKNKHISIVKNSGRLEEIILLKIWRKLHNLDFPSIYLELVTIEALRYKNKNQPAANFLSTLDYLKDNFVDKIIKDPANTNNVISDDLYKYEKEDIAKKAKESRNEEYWEKIIW